MIAACGGGSGGGGNSATAVALAGAGGTDSAAAAEAPASAPAPADVTAEPGVLSVAQAEAVREAQAATETLTVTALQSNVGADGTPFASSTPLPATPQAAASSDGGPAVSGVLRWSDRKTWGGELPGAGAQVVVPAGKTILLDIATPSLGALSIEGTLRFDDRNVALTASSINVTGTLEIGTVTAPFVNKATIASDSHANLTWGAAQAGVASGVAEAVVRKIVFDLDDVLIAAVWVNPNADDPEAVFANNEQATIDALAMGQSGRPTATESEDRPLEVWNPFFRPPRGRPEEAPR